MKFSTINFSFFLLFCALVTEFALGSIINNFIYLKSNEVNLRSGPDTKHPIKWIIHSKGEPLKIIDTFYQWINIEDISGNTGWIQSPMASKRNMHGIVINKTKEPIIAYALSSYSSRKMIRLEQRARVRVLKCDTSGWCKIFTKGIKAWLPQKNLWGINIK